ncbi:MAG TPA: hypothetical protein VGM07_01795 [Stellaceae bacterium]
MALGLTRLDTAAMNLFLAKLAQGLAPGAHGVVLMDKAGRHTAGDLVVPENLSLVFLPPPVQARGRLSSPELSAPRKLAMLLVTCSASAPWCWRLCG